MFSRMIVAYLCFFLAMGVHPVSAKPPGVPGQIPGAATPSQPVTDSLLDGASDFAGGFQGGPRFNTLSNGAAGKQNRLLSPGSEYVSGYYRGAVLMPVQLWGAVKLAGLHQVPTETDLARLLSLAGGPNSDAKLDRLTIRRTTKKGYEIINVDLVEYMESGNLEPIRIKPNDIVMLPADRPWISNNTLTLVSLIATIVGIVSTSLLIAKNS